jgi:predicted DNA-binding transcriptional regulator AlpA
MAARRQKSILQPPPAFLAFDHLPDSAQVRLPVVAALNGVSAVTVWRWSKTGSLPRPIRRGGVTTWNVGELRRTMTSASAK